MKRSLTIFFITLLLFCSLTQTSYAFHIRGSFDQYVARLRQEAIRRGISPRIVWLALGNIRPVVYNNPKFAGTFRPQINGLADYIRVSVTAKRIARGHHFAAKYHTLLNRVSREFNIPSTLIVAIWGLETDYGRLQGNYPEIATLATLAYKGRRERMFREQLFAALKVLQKGAIDLPSMKGSWAGAMGGCQFMPGTYLRYAVDYDGDGHKDIWNSPADTFASAANYLAHIGWNHRHGIVKAVKLPPNATRWWLLRTRGMHSLAAWRKAGLRELNGQALTPSNDNATLIFPYGPQRPYLLFRDNARSVYQWNHSTWYVISIGLLMDALEHGDG